MSFLYPEFLYYILPIVFILFGFLLTQKDAESHFFSDEVMNKLRVTTNGLTTQGRNLLFFITTILIVFALSGPVIDEGKIEVKAKSADIMLALDISDSMLAEDIYPNRLKSAKQKMIELLKLASTERVGVIAFAKNSYLVSPLSFDHSAVGFLLKQLGTDSITEKGTDFLSILNVVDSAIKKEGKKYLLLFSDGGDSKDFSEEIAFAQEKNIVVFIVGMGTKKGAPVKLKDGSFVKQKGAIIISKLNENIADLATKTGGVYIKNVNSTEDIKTMMQEIGKVSEKKELRSEEITKFIPLFYYPLGLAIFIFLFATSSFSKENLPKFLATFVVITLFITPQNVKAGLFDFSELGEAQKAYNEGNFAKSQKLYGNYAQTTKDAESYYNEGNSFYKEGKFDKALDSYNKATFSDTLSQSKKYANMGNSYVKQQKKDSLQKAKEAYEKSLKLHEDKDTRENLEAVKKAIEKQKKQQQKNKNKDKNQEDKKQQDKKKDSQDKQNKKDSQNKEDKKKSDEQKEKENSKKKDSQSKDSDKKEQEKNREKSDKEEKSQKQKEQAQQKEMKKSMMSDAEQAKWLKQLNAKQNTYMYRLGKQKMTKEKSDEKPW